MRPGHQRAGPHFQANPECYPDPCLNQGGLSNPCQASDACFNRACVRGAFQCFTGTPTGTSLSGQYATSCTEDEIPLSQVCGPSSRCEVQSCDPNAAAGLRARVQRHQLQRPDNDMCTDDSCNANTGCVYTPNSDECPFINDLCERGACNPPGVLARHSSLHHRPHRVRRQQRLHQRGVHRGPVRVHPSGRQLHWMNACRDLGGASV